MYGSISWWRPDSYSASFSPSPLNEATGFRRVSCFLSHQVKHLRASFMHPILFPPSSGKKIPKADTRDNSHQPDLKHHRHTMPCIEKIFIYSSSFPAGAEALTDFISPSPAFFT